MNNTKAFLSKQLSNQFHTVVTENIEDQIIWLYNNGNDMPVKVKNIYYCESQPSPNEHTDIFYWDEELGKICMVSSAYGIGKWDALLNKYGFCRIHRKHLVNYRHIIGISRIENMLEIRKMKQPFAISRTGKKKLAELMTGGTI